MGFSRWAFWYKNPLKGFFHSHSRLIKQRDHIFPRVATLAAQTLNPQAVLAANWRVPISWNVFVALNGRPWRAFPDVPISLYFSLSARWISRLSALLHRSPRLAHVFYGDSGNGLPLNRMIPAR